MSHPKLGASWEGYVLEEILTAQKPDEAYFWGSHMEYFHEERADDSRFHGMIGAGKQETRHGKVAL